MTSAPPDARHCPRCYSSDVHDDEHSTVTVPKQAFTRVRIHRRSTCHDCGWNSRLQRISDTTVPGEQLVLTLEGSSR